MVFQSNPNKTKNPSSAGSHGGAIITGLKWTPARRPSYDALSNVAHPLSIDPISEFSAWQSLQPEFSCQVPLPDRPIPPIRFLRISSRIGDRLDMAHRAACIGLIAALVYQTTVPCCICAAAKSQPETRNAAPSGCLRTSLLRHEKRFRTGRCRRKTGIVVPSAPSARHRWSNRGLAKTPSKIRRLECGDPIEKNREMLAADQLKIPRQDYALRTLRTAPPNAFGKTAGLGDLPRLPVDDFFDRSPDRPPSLLVRLVRLECSMPRFSFSSLRLAGLVLLCSSCANVESIRGSRELRKSSPPANPRPRRMSPHRLRGRSFKPKADSCRWR